MRPRWPPSVAQTARAVFPHAAFTKTHDLGGKEKGNYQVDLSYLRQVESSLQYPRTMMYGFFAKRTDPPSSSLLFWLPASSFLPSPATFPDPLWSPIARSRDFHHASGTIQPSDYGQSIARHFACAYRSAYPNATRDSVSSPEVTHCSSVPCRPQSPWCGG